MNAHLRTDWTPFPLSPKFFPKPNSIIMQHKSQVWGLDGHHLLVVSLATDWKNKRVPKNHYRFLTGFARFNGLA